jgi:hypothetical protein
MRFWVSLVREFVVEAANEREAYEAAVISIVESPDLLNVDRPRADVLYDEWAASRAVPPGNVVPIAVAAQSQAE